MKVLSCREYSSISCFQETLPFFMSSNNQETFTLRSPQCQLGPIILNHCHVTYRPPLCTSHPPKEQSCILFLLQISHAVQSTKNRNCLGLWLFPKLYILLKIKQEKLGSQSRCVELPALPPAPSTPCPVPKFYAGFLDHPELQGDKYQSVC